MSPRLRPYPQQDLDLVCEQLRPMVPTLRGSRIFVTGGTGFFGRWLIESWIAARRQLKLESEMTVLTRDPDQFISRHPHLIDTGLHWIRGDVRNFEFPSGSFTHIIHAATPASAKLNQEAPQEMFDTIVEGTRRVLDFAQRAKATHLLMTSSGAVYGPQPSDLTHVPETYPGSPDPLSPSSAYGEGKRAAEQLCAIAGARGAVSGGLQVKIARGFAFVGPGLPLDAHFAIGNFIRDGIRGGPIKVGGDGTPYRSYLYAADLTAWLWTILLRGTPGRAYNVGSDEDISISEIASRVARACPKARVETAQTPVPGAPIQRYVPSIARAREELGLQVTIPFDQALERTLRWHREENS